MWFQNRRAKFRKQERLAQQKANSQGQGQESDVKSEVKVKELKPSTPTSPSGPDVKPVNGAGTNTTGGGLHKVRQIANFQTLISLSDKIRAGNTSKNVLKLIVK